ncbi:MAG: putative wall-associated protein, partial [Caulobacteraceae bacterium]
STSYAYDPISRPSALTHDLAGTASDLNFGFGYNAASQVTTRPITSNDAAYTYAPAGQPTVTYARNGLNQYATVAGVAYGYDPNGNLTSDGATTFGYDVGNRLITATGARNAALSYDPLGRLYQVSSAGVTTRFLYDGGALVAEYNATGTMLRRYGMRPVIVLQRFADRLAVGFRAHRFARVARSALMRSRSGSSALKSGPRHSSISSCRSCLGSATAARNSS